MGFCQLLRIVLQKGREKSDLKAEMWAHERNILW